MPPRVPDGTIRRHPAGYLLEKSGDSFVLQHRLVWARSNGPIPKGAIIHHINEVRDDNRLENLELMASVSEHMRDKHGKGSRRGSGAPKSPEHRAKIAAAHKGKRFTAEHRLHISEARRRRPPPLPCSEPDCERISRSRGLCSLHYDRWLRAR